MARFSAKDWADWLRKQAAVDLAKTDGLAGLHHRVQEIAGKIIAAT
ncbi:hypothetical protein [Janthinobacterium sp. HLX7-2]